MRTSDFAPAPGHSDEVLYAVQGRLGRVRLNRPRAINALNPAMVASLLEVLRAWAVDDAVGAVLLDGAGDRGLCAGGDVRALREAILAGHHEDAEQFWVQEYALNALVADYPKPYVAWMDGVTMGGGLGVSAHGSHRLVTDRSSVAMPEVVIGFFPDVGILWHLAHAPGEMGTHVALTGTPVTGADAVLLGLADAVVDASGREAVADQVAAALAAGAAVPGPGDLGTPVASEPPLAAHRAWIDACYQGEDAAVTLDRLRSHDDPAAREAADTVAQRSPHSVAVTLEALRRARRLSVTEVLEQDRRLSAPMGAHPDFREGVRALLVDKDRAPRWQHAHVAEVDRATVLAAFGD